MNYHMDGAAFDLKALVDRLQRTDLIPSQEPLLEGVEQKMASLERSGVHSLAELRAALKTPQTMETLFQRSGVKVSYLTLLRRTINGFFPKPRALKEIDWLDDERIGALRAPD